MESVCFFWFQHRMPFTPMRTHCKIVQILLLDGFESLQKCSLAVVLLSYLNVNLVLMHLGSTFQALLLASEAWERISHWKHLPLGSVEVTAFRPWVYFQISDVTNWEAVLLLCYKICFWVSKGILSCVQSQRLLGLYWGSGVRHPFKMLSGRQKRQKMLLIQVTRHFYWGRP